MSVIKPFRALRPRTDLAEKVACVPYDVPYDSEVREYIADNPLSFDLNYYLAEGSIRSDRIIQKWKFSLNRKRI